MVVKSADVFKPASFNLKQRVTIFLLEVHSGNKYKNFETIIDLEDLDQRFYFAKICPRACQKKYFSNVTQNRSNLIARRSEYPLWQFFP